jgi:putative ABC transport system substrate-binding protein
MLRLPRFVLLLVGMLAMPLAAEAQEARVYRIGVITYGGPYLAAFDGLRDGLKELGLEEGNQVIFHMRDVRSDPKAVEAAAKGLEKEKVDLIYAVGTSITAVVKRATQNVPIVFYAGVDPATVGLVKTLAKPGGRLTGIHTRSTPLIGKRLELLKELMPSLRRVLFLANPGNATFGEGGRAAREAARQLKIELVERQVRSIDELRKTLDELPAGEVDALAYVDAMVVSQEAMMVQAATTKKLPLITSQRASVANGALASYGVSYYAGSRFAAKQVQRILLGANPADIAVEQLDRLHLAINLKTAKALGLKIPTSVLARADEVIE